MFFFFKSCTICIEMQYFESQASENVCFYRALEVFFNPRGLLLIHGLMKELYKFTTVSISQDLMTFILNLVSFLLHNFNHQWHKNVCMQEICSGGHILQEHCIYTWLAFLALVPRYVANWFPHSWFVYCNDINVLDQPRGSTACVNI